MKRFVLWFRVDSSWTRRKGRYASVQAAQDAIKTLGQETPGVVYLAVPEDRDPNQVVRRRP